MAYVSNILGYVNSKRESVPSGISVKFYNGDTFLSEVKLNVGDVIPQSSIPTVSSSDIYYSGTLGTYMDDLDPLRREKYTPTGSGFNLNGEAFDLTQPIKDNVRLVANVTSTTEYATKLTTVLMENGSATTTSDLGYIYVPSGTSISYQTFKDANISIDFLQYGPYKDGSSEDTASYVIGNNGTRTAFDPSYVWSDAGQSSTIFTSSNINANIILCLVQMTNVTVTFAEYSNGGYIVWSDSTISIPKGSSFVIPEFNNVQTPVNIPFKYTYYNTPLTVKTVTLSPNASGSYVSYIYGIGVDSANFPSAENSEINISANAAIIAFGGDYPPIRVLLNCTHGTFRDANDIKYCGQYNVFGSFYVNWNSNTQSLYDIQMRQYYSGTLARIVAIEPEEGYRVKGVDLYDTSGTYITRVDSSNVSADFQGGTIVPYAVEYHGYQYYGFDGASSNINLWWEGDMNPDYTQVSGWKDYLYNTFEALTGTRPSYSPNMYGQKNELFYVEGLNSSGAVVGGPKIYCFMTSGYGYADQAYFLVDVTNTPYISYTPYSNTFTISSKTDLGHYIMNELMSGNGCWGLCTFYPTNDFYNNAARNLYQTDSSAYNQKLTFYNNLKDNIQSGYGSLEII